MNERWIAMIERDDRTVIPCMQDEEQDEGCIRIFDSREEAQEYLADVPLYQAFGGYVINLDESSE